MLNSFRKEFLSIILNLTNSNTNFITHISKLRKTLLNLKNNNITVTKADKNIGIILINTNLYYNLCIEHLVNDNTYKKIKYNPQFNIYKKAYRIINELFDTGNISKKLLEVILSNLKYKKLAKFSILIKLHKLNKFGVRPLINCSNTTLTILSKLLDFIFKPIVMEHFSFIKDSQNLIQLTKKIRYEENVKLYSADFESLYTNIPLQKAIIIIMQLISLYNFSEISNYAIYQILKLVLLNNYFSFRHNNGLTFFLQTKGIAMGTACGPSIANLYLTYFELKYKKILNISLYYRFIDDILYCDLDNFLTNKFKEIFPDLILNCVTSNTVQFLDLNISFNMDRTLNFDLYIKPTFTGSYLNINSNHPKHVFKGIVTSQISRIRRNTTDYCNFLYHSTNILTHFLKKGFSFNLVTNIIRSFTKINRESLINYKKKENNKFNNSLLFIFPHMSNFNLNNKYINTIWYNSIQNSTILSQYNLKIISKTTPNLGSYLVSKYNNLVREGSYRKCENHLCKICEYAITDKNLFNFKNIELILPSNSHCKSTNIIYAIHCLKCKKSYIGQSSRTTEARITEHLRKILKYKKVQKTEIMTENENKDTFVLYNHFNDLEHTIKDHFRFQVISVDITNYRIRLETDLIYIFNTIHPKGLNNAILDFNDNFETYYFNY